MDKLLYDSFYNYFNILNITGYIPQNQSEYLILFDYLYSLIDVLDGQADIFDCKLINDVVYKLFDASYLIPSVGFDIENYIQKIENTTIYYGSIQHDIDSFYSISITDLIYNAKQFNIGGSCVQTISFTQDKNISYVILPSSLTTSLYAYFFDTFVTVLWDGTNGAYKTLYHNIEYNGVNCDVLYYYSPTGFINSNINISLNIN